MKSNILNVFIIILLWSCTDNNEKLDLKPLNTVEISGIAEEYRLKLYDLLEIKPKLKIAKDDSVLEYVWYMYDNNSLLTEADYDTLSTEKDLSYEIDNRVINAVDTEHQLVFKVIDKSTGVYYVHRSKVFASGIYGLGTLLLCKENEKNEINFIHRNNREFVDDVYGKANIDKPLGEHPTKIVFVNPLNRFLPELKEIMVFCENEDGGEILDPVTFKRTMSFREKVNAEFVGVLTPIFHFQVQKDYLIYNGNSCSKPLSASMYDPIFAIVSEPGEVELAPMVWKILEYETEYGYTNGGPIYYDQKNHRFLEHGMENKGYLKAMKNTENSAFDCNHVGEHMQLVCGGKLPGRGNGWALMKEETTSKFFLLKFATTMEFPISNNKQYCVITFSGTDKIELTPAYSNNIQDAKYISSVYNVEDGAFVFATDKSVFAFNVNQASSTNPVNMEVELIADLSRENIVISNMEYISYEVENPDDIWEPFIVKEVRLSIQDNNRTMQKGGVIFYELDTQGGLHLKEVYRKSGFCDEVIDIEEKYS